MDDIYNQEIKKNGAKIIRQNWECFGNGTVVCQEAIEDCSACDGMVKIKDLTNSYNLATGTGGIEACFLS